MDVCIHYSAHVPIYCTADIVLSLLLLLFRRLHTGTFLCPICFRPLRENCTTFVFATLTRRPATSSVCFHRASCSIRWSFVSAISARSSADKSSHGIPL